MEKKYVVRLTSEERERLKALVSKGRASARKIGRAQVLLKVDADGANWTDQQAAERFRYAQIQWRTSAGDASKRVWIALSIGKDRTNLRRAGSLTALARHG